MMKKLFLLILILCFATPCFAGDGIIFFDSFESTCGAAYGDCTYNEGENIDDGYFWGRDMMCGSCTAQLGGLEGSQAPIISPILIAIAYQTRIVVIELRWYQGRIGIIGDVQAHKIPATVTGFVHLRLEIITDYARTRNTGLAWQ